MSSFEFGAVDFESRRAIHNAFAATTVKHIDRNGSMFEALEYNPDKYPSQKLEVIHTEPKESSMPELDALASFSNTRHLYPYMKEALSRQKDLRDELKRARNEGENIIVIGNHQSMPDIAELEIAMMAAEDAQTHEEWKTIQENNGLVISRGVSTLSAYGYPASELVQRIGHVFMVFPRTKTIENLKLPETVDQTKLILGSNEIARNEAKKWLGRFATSEDGNNNFLGKRLFISWAGSTDHVDYSDEQAIRVTLGKVHNGIIDIIRNANILPVVMWDRGAEKEPIFIMGEMTRLSKKEDIPGVVKWQKDTLSKALGIPVDYVKIPAPASSVEKNKILTS